MFTVLSKQVIAGYGPRSKTLADQYSLRSGAVIGLGAGNPHKLTGLSSLCRQASSSDNQISLILVSDFICQKKANRETVTLSKSVSNTLY